MGEIIRMTKMKDDDRSEELREIIALKAAAETPARR